jgi:hypothetical protein
LIDSYGSYFTYRFHAVYSGSEENKAFWEATPSGDLTLSSAKPGLFEKDQEYYLDFIPTN